MNEKERKQWLASTKSQIRDAADREIMRPKFAQTFTDDLYDEVIVPGMVHHERDIKTMRKVAYGFRGFTALSSAALALAAFIDPWVLILTGSWLVPSMVGTIIMNGRYKQSTKNWQAQLASLQNKAIQNISIPDPMRLTIVSDRTYRSSVDGLVKADSRFADAMTSELERLGINPNEFAHSISIQYRIDLTFEKAGDPIYNEFYILDMLPDHLGFRGIMKNAIDWFEYRADHFNMHQIKRLISKWGAPDNVGKITFVGGEVPTGPLYEHLLLFPYYMALSMRKINGLLSEYNDLDMKLVATIQYRADTRDKNERKRAQSIYSHIFQSVGTELYLDDFNGLITQQALLCAIFTSDGTEEGSSTVKLPLDAILPAQSIRLNFNPMFTDQGFTGTCATSILNRIRRDRKVSDPPVMVDQSESFSETAIDKGVSGVLPDYALQIGLIRQDIKELTGAIEALKAYVEKSIQPPQGEFVAAEMVVTLQIAESTPSFYIPLSNQNRYESVWGWVDLFMELKVNANLTDAKMKHNYKMMTTKDGAMMIHKEMCDYFDKHNLWKVDSKDVWTRNYGLIMKRINNWLDRLFTYSGQVYTYSVLINEKPISNQSSKF